MNSLSPGEKDALDVLRGHDGLKAIAVLLDDFVKQKENELINYNLEAASSSVENMAYRKCEADGARLLAKFFRRKFASPIND